MRVPPPPKGHRRVLADMVVNVTERLPDGSGLNEWPRMLQDKVYKEFEKRGIAKGRRWKYLRSRCGVDGNVPYIHVTMYDDVPLILGPGTKQ